MKLLYACLIVSAGALAQVRDGNAQPNGTASGASRGFTSKQETGRADRVSTSGAVMQQHRSSDLPVGTLSVELATLPSGLYVISIDTDQGRVQRKAMRE